MRPLCRVLVVLLAACSWLWCALPSPAAAAELPPPVITTPSDGDILAPVVTFGALYTYSEVEFIVDGRAVGRARPQEWTTEEIFLGGVPPFDDGPHEFYAVGINAQQRSAPSETRHFVVESTPPSVPTITAPTEGEKLYDGNRVRIAGTADPGNSVSATVDGKPVGSATTGTDGRFELTVALSVADGNHVIQVSTSSRVGISRTSAPRVFYAQFRGPLQPTITEPTYRQRITTSTPTIAGRGEVRRDVTVAIGDLGTTSTRTDDRGDYRVVFPRPVPDGTAVATVYLTDSRGRQSGRMTRTFIIDTTPPSPPTILAPLPDAVVSSARPLLRGAGEVGSTVELRLDGGAPITAAVSGFGRWDHTPERDLVAGPHQLSAVQIDNSGLRSTAVALRFVVPGDPPPPSPSPSPTISASPSPSPTASASPTPTISASPSPTPTTSASATVSPSPTAPSPTASAPTPPSPSDPLPAPSATGSSAPILADPSSTADPTERRSTNRARLAATGGPSLVLAVTGGVLMVGGGLLLLRRRRC